MKRVDRICKYCGKEFKIWNCTIKRGSGKYCSRECYISANKGENNSLWKGGKIVQSCEICSKSFKIFPSRKGIRKYCSKECGRIGIAITNHYSRKGVNSPNWNGGRHINKHGYVMVHDENGGKYRKGSYVIEHRKVMENHIGRELLFSEIVHHIDGNRKNNDIENLKLMTRKEHVKGYYFENKRIICPICKHSAELRKFVNE